MEKQEISVDSLLIVIDKLKDENEQLRQQNQWLIEQIRLSKHRQFGASSEQTAVNGGEQTSLFNEAEQCADLTALEPLITEVKAYRRKRTRLTTDKLPEDLPVETLLYTISDEDRICPDCGSEMHKMGENCREELVLIPATAKIRRHLTYVYSCRHCERHAESVPIIEAELPEPVIKGGMASPEAIAHIATQKFVMGSPLYRQEQEWNSQGILLSRQTMSNWLMKACEDWLKPIYEEMKRQLCAFDVLHADETTLQVLHEDEKSAKSKSYMWLYRTSGDAQQQIVLYDYQKSRGRENPKRFLKDFSGFLHADGYDAYHALPNGITVVGCWAHLRRKFDEAMKSLPKDRQRPSSASDGIDFCDKLFLFEKQFAKITPEERFKERQRVSLPLMEEFFAWADSLNVLPQCLLGKAVTYSQNQRKYLKNFLLDGRLELSNNRAERSIKPFVIGRKNWLFANTKKGATASAIYYSLIMTAKENGLNPFEYLARVFSQAPNGAKTTHLLPWKP